MNRWKLLLHTVRYLKLQQIFYQIYYRIHKLRLSSHKEPVLRGELKEWSGAVFLTPATDDGRTFTFLGQVASLEGDWNDPSFSKLWLYNLHYQDDLTAKGAEQRPGLCEYMVDSWIAGNPPLRGNGWEPYCLSLRLVNWVKCFSRLKQTQVKQEWLRSLTMQADALEQQLEFHILANHLFANAKGLVFVGTYLGGEQGDDWLYKGLSLLDAELQEQFLGDGGHYERSPMYHAILLWDVCDLLQLQEHTQLSCFAERSTQWRDILAKGLRWLRAMVHPDRDIAFFNDATFGIAPTLEDLERYCSKLGVTVCEDPCNGTNWSVTYLDDSGYVTVDHAGRHRALLDIAEIGPKYQPGHAHADTLSFELSLFGQRLFVNSGTSQYGTGPEREYQRGTAAHNTVQVDNENSSEIWAGFRVARRAQPRDISVDFNESTLLVSGAHDGYRRLSGKVHTMRSWRFGDRAIQIVDELSGKYAKAISRFYCHPAIAVNQPSENEILLFLPEGQEVRFTVEGASALRVVESTWHPGFGISTPNSCIEAVMSGSRLVSRIGYRDS